MSDNEIRIPAAVIGAAIAAMLGALATWLALRRREDDRWLEALTRRSGSDERRRGGLPPRWPAADPVGQELPVDNQAIEPVTGNRITVIR